MPRAVSLGLAASSCFNFASLASAMSCTPRCRVSAGADLYFAERDKPARRFLNPRVARVKVGAHEIHVAEFLVCVVVLGIFGWQLERTDSILWALAKSASTLAAIGLVSAFVTAWAVTSDAAHKSTKNVQRHATGQSSKVY